MYIPSADMGEYDDYHHPLPGKHGQVSGAKYGSLDRQQSRPKLGDRQSSRGTLDKPKLGKTPKLPSGYFVLDGKKEQRQAQGGLRRQQSFNR